MLAAFPTFWRYPSAWHHLFSSAQVALHRQVEKPASNSQATLPASAGASTAA
jgi:hypothetical protein